MLFDYPTKTSPPSSKMIVKAPVQISQKVIVPLSVLMVAAAMLSFFDHDGVLNFGTTPRLFTTSRVPVQSNLSSLAAEYGLY